MKSFPSHIFFSKCKNNTTFKMDLFIFVHKLFKNVPILCTLISQQPKELQRCSFYDLNLLFLLYAGELIIAKAGKQEKGSKCTGDVTGLE